MTRRGKEQGLTVSSYQSPTMSDAPNPYVGCSQPASTAHNGAQQCSAGNAILSVLSTNSPGSSPIDDDHPTSNTDDALFHFGLNGSILKSIGIYQSLNGVHPEPKSQLNSVSG